MVKQWVYSNPRLIKGCVKPWILVEFKEDKNEVFVNLDYFNENYINKHIAGKLKNYSNAFIERLTPVLKGYLKEVEKTDVTFVIIFNHRMIKLIKDVRVDIVD